MIKSSRRAILILMLLMITMAAGCNKSEPQAAATVINVESAVARTASISQYTNYSGRVKGSHEVSVMPKVASRVTKVYVEAGQQVSQGQILMSLDKTDLEVEIKQKEAALASARASQASNQISLQSAQRSYKRAQELYKAGAISDQDLEDARDKYDSLRSGSVEASVAQAQASLLALRQQIDNCDIKSPIDGIVGRVDISVGDTASLASPVAVINKSGELEIEVLVNENDIPFVEVGREVKLTVHAVGGDTLTGNIKSVSTIARQDSLSYPVTVTLNNPHAGIRSGMFADVKLPTRYKENVLVIPLVAVIPRDGGNIVYVVNDRNQAHQVAVETGINDDKYIEITKGLKAGERVITTGNTLVDEGTTLKLAGGENK